MSQLVIVFLEVLTFGNRLKFVFYNKKISATVPQQVIVLLESFTFSNKLKYKCLHKKICNYATVSDCVVGRHSLLVID